MKNLVIEYVLKSLYRYRKPVMVRIILTAILAMVITGTLLTGFSVRESLRRNSSARLGEADLLVTSGIRFLSADLSDRLDGKWQYESVPLTELRGFCTLFSTGLKIPQVNIFAIRSDFFPFHGSGLPVPGKGEAVINSKLAETAGIKTGDEIIVSVAETSELSSGSPFSPGRESNNSSVYRVAAIADEANAGNFSLSISQIEPLNIFIGSDDLPGTGELSGKANRIIVKTGGGSGKNEAEKHITEEFKLSDGGLTVRNIPGEDTGYEIVSSRIFIDESGTDFLLRNIEGSYPVLTYLANSISTARGKSTPYSFVSAIGRYKIENELPADGIIINSWLAGDLSAEKGDTLELSWYIEHPDGSLTEQKEKFTVAGIVSMEGNWADSTLMPAFPGIAGSESCTDWDAGVEIDMSRIRDKDEEYWSIFKGTPKAFILYNRAETIWKNNYGPATAVRFEKMPEGAGLSDLLAGSLVPSMFGISVKEIRKEAIRAASEGTDFSTLFLSLSFFLILSAIIMTALSAKAYIENRRENIFTLYALGFTVKKIRKIFTTETVLTAFAGTVAGSALAPLLNLIIVKALNSAWLGAVQTDTIEAYISPVSLAGGFFVSLAVTFTLLAVTVSKHLKKLFSHGREVARPLKARPEISIALIILAVAVFASSYFSKGNEAMLGFISGAILFAGLIHLVRSFSVRGFRRGKGKISPAWFSSRYYSLFPSEAVLPALFLATGLFAVTVTGMNRLSVTEGSRSLKGGTGGYTVWAESRIPYPVSVKSDEGTEKFGLETTDSIFVSLEECRILGGDDASCLNLNHVTSPPLLSVNSAGFSERNGFSFAVVTDKEFRENPWDILRKNGNDSTMFAVADQTVVQWGLKLKAGDTLKYLAENGRKVDVIIAATLDPSVFQGFLIVDEHEFLKHFPSVSGYSVLLAETTAESTDSLVTLLNDRFSNYGLKAERAEVRLSKFFIVTNTYLSVFTILGALGVILGVFGLGFSLSRNYRQRKREFAVMLATGISPGKIRGMLSAEQGMILTAGTVSGLLPAFMATWHSLSDGSINALITVLVIAVMVWITGKAVQYFTIRYITSDSLATVLRGD